MGIALIHHLSAGMTPPEKLDHRFLASILDQVSDLAVTEQVGGDVLFDTSTLGNIPDLLGDACILELVATSAVSTATRCQEHKVLPVASPG